MTNHKLVLNTFIYNIFGGILFVVTFLLDVYSIIDIYNVTINSIFLTVSSIISLIYYGNNYYLIRNVAGVNDCVIMGVLTAVFLSPQLFFSLKYPGVHLSIAVTWGFGSIALVVFNIITYLRSIDSIEMSKKKYDRVIPYLKTWAVICYIGSYLFAINNIFAPDDMVFFDRKVLL